MTHILRNCRRWSLSAIVLLTALPFFLGNTWLVRTATLLICLAIWTSAWDLYAGPFSRIPLGHSLFVGLAQYAFLIGLVTHKLNPYLAAAIGVSLGGVVGAAVGIAFWRVSKTAFALSSIALVMLVRTVIETREHVMGMATGSVHGIELNVMTMNSPFLQNPIMAYGILCLILVVLTLFRAFIYGRRARHLLFFEGDSPLSSDLMGIRQGWHHGLFMGLSALFVSMAAVPALTLSGFVNPESAFSHDISFKIALFGLVGGRGTLWGPLLAAYILFPIEYFCRVKWGGGAVGLHIFVYSAIAFAVIVRWPRWLFRRLEFRL